MSSLQEIKQRFGIVGNSPLLNQAIGRAMQVAPTDITVLVVGESGAGKEFIPKIIHQLSVRKHQNYIAVNCGAIPEGTIDSELFGHEKGSFTGASQTRKGYFEVADGGTIFLDEVAELPLTTQVRLLRVLETGEFMKVGSSQIQKTQVRIVAATHVDLAKAVEKGNFREDLYYRLNTVQINLPPLRARDGDMVLLFKKFANDFSEKYKIPSVQLSETAQNYILQYAWPGNVRQLRNIVEEISVVEKQRYIDLATLQGYLPQTALSKSKNIEDNASSNHFANERELLYTVLFDMKKDLNDLKSLTLELMKQQDGAQLIKQNHPQLMRVFQESPKPLLPEIQSFEKESPLLQNTYLTKNNPSREIIIDDDAYQQKFNNDVKHQTKINSQDELSLQDNELELIKRALFKSQGKRKLAARSLGISERTLYRKIKQYDL